MISNQKDEEKNVVYLWDLCFAEFLYAFILNS